MINYLIAHLLLRHIGMLENFHNITVQSAVLLGMSSASVFFYFKSFFFGCRDEAYSKNFSCSTGP